MANDNLYLDIINFVQSYREVPAIEFELVDVDLNNRQAILNNEQVMSLVDKYSEAYKLDRELVIAILANNCQDGAINFKDPFGVGPSWVGKIDSRRTVWNYETETADNLMDYQHSATASLENAIRFGAMALANAYKESNGNTADAIEIFYAGPGPMGVKPRNPNKTSFLYKNEVLSIMALSHGDERVKLSYCFTLNEDFVRNITELYGHELTNDEIMDLTDQITQQFMIHLQAFEAGKAK